MSDARAGGDEPVTAAELATFALFDDSRPDDIATVVDHLEPVTFVAGATVLSAGDPGAFFLLLREGAVSVVLPDGVRHEPITLGRGEMLGELSILRGSPRAATVVATTDVRALRGDREAFAALLAIPGVANRLRRTAAGRLASNAEPVEVELADGTRAWLRPVLPTDWELMRAALEHVSPEFFRLRFFSGGRPTDRMLHDLIDIDYANHFAWAAFVDGPAGDEAVGSGRYVCRRDHPRSAELALGVVDDYQGRGLGGLLVGALAAAAPAVGIDRFYAMTSSDNGPMKRLLTRFGARWDHEEPGVVATEVDIGPLVESLPGVTRDSLARIAANVIAAAQATAV